MSSDAEMISKAILDLKNNSDFVKDYIFPICMSFFSALLGALAGYLLYKRQVLVGYEELKFNAAMDIILKYNACLNNLITLKSNYNKRYHPNLMTDPIQRALGFPAVIMDNDKVSEDVLALSFILAKLKGRRNWLRRKHTQLSQQAKSWINLTRLRANLTNYNHAIALISKRSTMDTEIRKDLDSLLKQNSPTLTAPNELIIHIVGTTRMAVYIDLTEQCIALVDMLVLEMHMFMESFPELANEYLNTGLIKHRGRLPSYIPGKEPYLNALKPMPKPDVQKMIDLTGMSKEEIEFTYNFGSWETHGS